MMMRRAESLPWSPAIDSMMHHPCAMVCTSARPHYGVGTLLCSCCPFLCAQVLQTVDPASFKTVLVETNLEHAGMPAADADKNAHVDRMLTRAGLVRVLELGNPVNHAYVRRDVLDRCGHAVNVSCTAIQRDYRLPVMDCKRHLNFKVPSHLARPG